LLLLLLLLLLLGDDEDAGERLGAATAWQAKKTTHAKHNRRHRHVFWDDMISSPRTASSSRGSLGSNRICSSLALVFSLFPDE
jgi:hypothetical protein